MSFPLYQVDAFSSLPFRGNPAAVCLLDSSQPDGWMQAVAQEMNLSETAFLLPEGDGWRLRWFTPTIEVDLCGHATLASAHVLWETGRLTHNETARFHSRSGLPTAARDAEWITLDFPAKPAEAADPPSTLLYALGIDPEEAVYVGRNAFDYLVEVRREETVRALSPDHASLRCLPVRGIIVTARASSRDYDFVSRFFAPGSGIDEDPVTGSAHCCLGPYWQSGLGKSELVGYQASARGGVVRVKVNGGRILLGGKAVTIFRGELLELNFTHDIHRHR